MHSQAAGLAEADVPGAVHAMRQRGVWREHVRQNTGRRLYRFNWLQHQMLPLLYRPPKGTTIMGDRLTA